MGGGITVAIVLMALRSVPTRRMGSAAGAVLGAATLLFASAEFVALQAQYWLPGTEGLDEVRTVLAMTVLTLAGLAGAVWHSRLQWSLLMVAAMAAATVFGLAVIVGYGVRSDRARDGPAGDRRHPLRRRAGSCATPRRAAGRRSARGSRCSPCRRCCTTSANPTCGASSRSASSRSRSSWSAPSCKLQAPLVLGSIVVLAHGVAQLWPWITAGYDVVPWWLWLGIGGALLIFLAATYERRVRQLKAGFVAVTSLR